MKLLRANTTAARQPQRTYSGFAPFMLATFVVISTAACQRPSNDEESASEAAAASAENAEAENAESNASEAPVRRAGQPPAIDISTLPELSDDEPELDVTVERGAASSPLGTACIGFYAMEPHARIEIEEARALTLAFVDEQGRDSTLALQRCDNERCHEIYCDDDSGGDGQPQISTSLSEGTWLVYAGSYTPRRELGGHLHLLDSPDLAPSCSETVSLTSASPLRREGTLEQALYSCLWHPGIAGCRGFMPENPQVCVEVGEAGLLVAEVVSATFDTVLALGEGAGLGGQRRFNDDAGGTVLSTTSLRAQPGTTYAILLGSYRRDQGGDWLLEVRLDSADAAEGGDDADSQQSPEATQQ